MMYSSKLSTRAKL